MTAPLHASAKLPALDGLRGFACIIVVYFHNALYGWGGLLIPWADVGVMLFFTLSGFLMAFHYQPARWRARYWASFLTRRFFRIYPAFFAASFGWLIFAPEMAAVGHKGLETPWENLVQNWTLQQGTGIFWTIRMEIFFYLCYPLLMWPVLCLPEGPRRVALLAALWMLLLLLNTQIWLPGFLKCCLFFLGGAVAASAIRYLPDFRRIPAWRWDMFALLLLACFVWLLAENPLNLRLRVARAYDHCHIFAPLLALAVLILAMARGAACRLFALWPLRWTGKVSYSLYLTHIFVQVPAKRHWPQELQEPWLVLLAVLAVTLLFYHLVEHPFHRLGITLSRRMMPKEPPGA